MNHVHEWTEAACNNDGHGRLEVTDWRCSCGQSFDAHQRDFLRSAILSRSPSAGDVG